MMQMKENMNPPTKITLCRDLKTSTSWCLQTLIKSKTLKLEPLFALFFVQLPPAATDPILLISLFSFVLSSCCSWAVWNLQPMHDRWGEETEEREERGEEKVSWGEERERRKGKERGEIRRSNGVREVKREEWVEDKWKRRKKEEKKAKQAKTAKTRVKTCWKDDKERVMRKWWRNKEREKKGGGCLHNRRESLYNGATPICILWGIGPLYNGPIKRNNVVYETRRYLQST